MLAYAPATAFAGGMNIPILTVPQSTQIHVKAGAGGAVGGLVCGAGTMLYARLRSGGKAHDTDPMLWRQTVGSGELIPLLAEEAAVGGAIGSLASDPGHGLLLGGGATCFLDVVWVVSSEIVAAHQEPALALVQEHDGSWQVGTPPVAVLPDGVVVPLLAIRF